MLREQNLNTIALADAILDQALPLEVLAILVARDAYPGLDVGYVQGELSSFANGLSLAGLPALEQAHALRQHLYSVHGFHGNEEDYHDPRNSYLNEVVTRRTGIPITLACVVMATGRQAGVYVEGIGFPGHFLVRIGGPEGVYMDPFFAGRVLDEAGMAQLAHRVLGPAQQLSREHLMSVGPRALVTRMLTNLKQSHELRREHAQALLVCDRLVDLKAGPEVRRDRGLHALALGANEAAAADLEAYLSEKPAAQDWQAIQDAAIKARGAVILQ